MDSKAIILDGSTQYGEVANFSLIDAMTDGVGTIEGWFWNDPSSSPYSSAVNFDKSDDSSASQLTTENAIGSEGTNFKYDYGVGTDADGWAAGGVFTQSTWVHVAERFQLNDGTDIFKNGVEISYNAQTAGVGTPTSFDSMPFNIGRSQRTVPDPMWKGRIGGFIRVWNVWRSMQEIKDNMNCWLNAPRENGLIINLNFQEGSGSTIENNAYSTVPCILTGSPTWTTGPLSLVPKQYKYQFGNSIRPRPFAPGIAR